MKDNEKKTIIGTDKEPPKNYIGGKSDTEFYEGNGKTGEESDLFKTAETKPIKSIVLNRTDVAVMPGHTASLVATVEPEDSSERVVTGISSNPDIASVSKSGRVSIKKNAVLGDMVIIIAAIGGKSASCKITIG